MNQWLYKDEWINDYIRMNKSMTTSVWIKQRLYKNEWIND